MAPEPARDAHRHPQFAHRRGTDPDRAEAASDRLPQDERVAALDPPAVADASAGAAAHALADRGMAPAARRPGNRWWASLLARSATAARRLGVALRPRLDRTVAAAGRVPPGAAAAGTIGIAALVLALLAGDGDTEFPGFSFEAGLLSRPPSSQAVEASDTPVLHAALAPDELAERLVEDPAFDPLPGARGGAMLPGAEPPAPPDATASSGANGGKDAVAVLSAASPPPADPTLRLLERLRLRSSIAGASRPAAALAAPASAKTEAAGSERGFAVQLLAAGRREQTVEAWGRLQRNNADLLGRLQPIIVEPERKVSNLFRLRAGPVASAREAQALCASLARRSVDCIVVQGGG